MKLIILHSNDTHGHLTPIPGPDGPPLGGYARRATFVKQERAAHPQLLLLDAGDFYQGSKYWHAFRGEPDIDLMNLLDYDAAALGNHDFDGGLELLAARLRQAHFPILCTNMSLPPDHFLAGAWQPYVIKRIGSIRVALFSLLVDAMLLYPPEFREVVRPAPIVETAARMVSRLRAQAEVVILLSHLGHMEDVSLAEQVSGIDLIIGGHSHTALSEAQWVNGTPIVRSLSGSQVMGRVELQIEVGGRPELTDYRLIPLDDRFIEDPTVLANLAPWTARLPPETVLGRLGIPLDTRTEVKGAGESTAGNLFADAMLDFYAPEAELAFVHMGTLRGDRIYAAGPFTNHDLSEYHPFDNQAILMEITGPQLKQILERGVSALPEPTGIFLSQAGLQVAVDPTQPAQQIDPNHPRLLAPGRRIIRAAFRDRPIDFHDPGRTFKVVMDGYIGRGGAGYFITQQGRNIRQAEETGATVIETYLRRRSPVYPQLDGRIRILS